MKFPGSRTVVVQDESARSVPVQALLMFAFASLTAIGAQVELPHQPVPYTLQTMIVLLAGALLGKRNGAMSQGMYLLAGLAGMPVFSGFGFGAARLLGPAGGYLLSFPIAAFVVGYLLDGKNNFLRTAVAMATGLFVIFTFGTLQLKMVLNLSWAAALSDGFLIFSWWDLAKLAAAALVYRRLAGNLRLS